MQSTTKTIPLFLFGLAAVPSLLGAANPNDSEPPIVTPGGRSGQAPSDAIVLFDGKDLSRWESVKGGPAKWTVQDGAMIVNRTGNIRTKQSFGNVQLHVEWATPREVKGKGQGRGNSGVYLQGRYEIQILDSYENKTYFNGQAGAFYGNKPPLVNASRKPGEWQSYDIIFIAPQPSKDGTGVIPGSFTVFHNGVLIQNHVPIAGKKTTAANFSGAAVKGPLILQDHGNPVRFRNIWIRPLPSASPKIQKQSSIRIEITTDGKVAYNGNEIGVRGVRSVVKRILKQKKNLPVIIQVDEDSSLDIVAKVHDQATLAGAENVHLSKRR